MIFGRPCFWFTLSFVLFFFWGACDGFGLGMEALQVSGFVGSELTTVGWDLGFAGLGFQGVRVF